MASKKVPAFQSFSAVEGGKLTGTTDTDYFYFFCPRCGDRHMMRILDYEVRQDGPVEAYLDVQPKQARDFTLALELYCSNCKQPASVKISNTGWQGGQMPAESDTRS